MTRASSQPQAVLLDVLGRRVRVEAGGHPSAAQVDALWSRCRPTDTASGYVGVDGGPHDETVIALPRSDRPLTPEAGLHLADELRELALAAAADRLVVLRAAAVATPDGAVLGLFTADPAQRAEAAAELSRRGFGYVTDELLATDESFDVVAFAEPLRFEQDAQTGPESSTLAGPDALGMRPCPEGPLHLAAAVLLEHDPAHLGAPELTRVRRPDDVRRLESAVVTSPTAWSATALPDLIDEVDGLWVLRYADIAPVLAELVLARTQQPAGPAQLYVAVGIGDSDDRPTAVSGHLLALDGLRRVVWMAAAGGASIEDLHAAANRELAGKTAISVQLVAAAVRDLMALRLLVPEEGAGRLTLVEGVPANHG